MSDDCWVWFGWICLVGWFAQSNSTLSQRVGMKEVPARKLRGFTGISLQCVPGFRMVQLIRNATAPSVQGHWTDLGVQSLCFNVLWVLNTETQWVSWAERCSKTIESWPKFLRNLNIFKQWFASLWNFECFADLCLHFSHFYFFDLVLKRFCFIPLIFFGESQWPSLTFIFLWCERNDHQCDLSLLNNL